MIQVQSRIEIVPQRQERSGTALVSELEQITPKRIYDGVPCKTIHYGNKVVRCQIGTLG